jgi:hypothetical protein
VPDAVELAGLGCVAVAAFLVATALGFLVLGLLLVLVAQGLDGAPLAALVRGWVARLPHAGQGDS